MFGALGPQLQLWRTRGGRNTAQDTFVIDNAFVLIDGMCEMSNRGTIGIVGESTRRAGEAVTAIT
jgi:hypothetical protein